MSATLINHLIGFVQGDVNITQVMYRKLIQSANVPWQYSPLSLNGEITRLLTLLRLTYKLYRVPNIKQDLAWSILQYFVTIVS